MPPGLREVGKPVLLVGGELEDGVESRTLRPSSAVTVTSRVRLLTTAAGVSELTSPPSDRGAAVRVILTKTHDTVVEESTRHSPSTALSVSCIQEDTLVLQTSALSLPLTRSNARGMLKVVVVGKTEITVKHHLEVSRVLTLVNSLPLISTRVTADVEARTPALCKKRLIEVVVEDTLVFKIAPMALVTRVFDPGLAKSVSTSQSSDISPDHFFALDMF